MDTNTKTLVGVLIVATALFAAWAFVGGQYRTIGVLTTAITERDRMIAERESIMKNVDGLYNQYVQRQQDVERFASVVPAGSSIAEIVSALDTISRQSGLQLTSIAVQGGNREGDAGPSGNLTIPMQLVGGYESLAVFLSNIEQNLRLLDITGIAISVDPASPTLLHFDLQVTAYFVK